MSRATPSRTGQFRPAPSRPVRSAESGPRRPAGALGALGELATALARLVVPVQCPGCGAWDEVLCAGCDQHLRGPVRRCEQAAPRLDRMDGTPPLPVWAAAPYAGPVRPVVVAWKDRGRTDLGVALGDAARRVGRVVAPEVSRAARDAPVLVVPVPSSAAARRRRGEDLVGRLAHEVAAGLVRGGAPARVTPALARRRGGRDQVGLGARARGANTAGAWTVRSSWVSTIRASPCVLVDDVVTTGSTLAGCERVLSGSGGLVLGAVVLAATPPPTQDL